jgi:hypothetical protein
MRTNTLPSVTAAGVTPLDHTILSGNFPPSIDMRIGRTNMRAMRAETFNGYKELKLVDLPKPAVTSNRSRIDSVRGVR